MKPLLAGLAALLLGSSLLLAHGDKHWPAPEKARKRKNPVAATVSSIKEGAMLYQGNCLVCHGEKGNGKGPWVEKLPRQPADFTDRHMMSQMTDGEIFWKVSTGRYPMPAFAEKLSEEQRWHLVNYVRTFAKSAQHTSAGKHNP